MSKPKKRFFGLTNHIGASNKKTGWKFHIDVLKKIAMKKGVMNAHLMETPSFGKGESQ